MKQLLASVLLFASLPSAAYADPPNRQTPLGYQQISAFSTAQALTAPSGATFAVISVETQAVRYRDDGTAPTASAGMPIAVGAAPFVYTGSLSAIQFIPQTGSATLDIAYYK